MFDFDSCSEEWIVIVNTIISLLLSVIYNDFGSSIIHKRLLILIRWSHGCLFHLGMSTSRLVSPFPEHDLDFTLSVLSLHWNHRWILLQALILLHQLIWIWRLLGLIQVFTFIWICLVCISMDPANNPAGLIHWELTDGLFMALLLRHESWFNHSK